MHALALVSVHSPQIVLPEGSTPHIQLILRWIHFGAGIHLGRAALFLCSDQCQVSSRTRRIDAHESCARADAAYSLVVRWSSVVTVLAGIWYWMMIVGADARNAQPAAAEPLGLSSAYGPSYSP